MGNLWGLSEERYESEIVSRSLGARTDTKTWRNTERLLLGQLERLPQPPESYTLQFPRSDYLHLERVLDDALRSGTVRGTPAYEPPGQDLPERPRLHAPALTSLGRLRLQQLQARTLDAHFTRFCARAVAAAAGVLLAFLLLALLSELLNL